MCHEFFVVFVERGTAGLYPGHDFRECMIGGKIVISLDAPVHIAVDLI